MIQFISPWRWISIDVASSTISYQPMKACVALRWMKAYRRSIHSSRSEWFNAPDYEEVRIQHTYQSRIFIIIEKSGFQG